MTESEIAKALGQEYSQMFSEIEEGLWSFEADHPGNPFCFTLDGLQGACKIFSTVLLDYLWLKEKNSPQAIREAKALEAGQAIRELVLKYTNLDTHKLYK